MQHLEVSCAVRPILVAVRRQMGKISSQLSCRMLESQANIIHVTSLYFRRVFVSLQVYLTNRFKRASVKRERYSLYFIIVHFKLQAASLNVLCVQFIIIIVIIIIFINCNWVVTRWQWLYEITVMNKRKYGDQSLVPI